MMDECMILNVENCACQVVGLVREFIDELRQHKDLSPSSLNEKSVSSGTKEETKQSIVFDSNFFAKIGQLSAKIQSSIPDEKGFWSSAYFSFADETPTSTGWNMIVYNIIYPLLNSIGRCYQVLDALPDPPLFQDGNSNRMKAPQPPPGMLSIQNYTDIAMMLEFTVCTSILPLLEPNILPPLVERIKALPRTLAGRAPHVAMRNGASRRQDTAQDHTRRKRELLCSGTLLGNLLHLDRFRPMLLPRHLADIYAALFQADQLAVQDYSNCDIATAPAFRHLRSVLLEDEMEMISYSIHRARTFQQLLVQGRRGPLWLRRRVSSLLNFLATTRLEAVIQVFIHSAPGDKTAAALRLARTLTMKVNSKVDKRGKDHFSLLAQQLLVVLDSCLFRSGEEPMGDGNEVFTIEFIWMVLDNLSDDVVVNTIFNSFSAPFLVRKPMKTSEGADGGDVSIHQTVLRIEKLLSAPPSHAVARCRFCRLVLFKPLREFPGASASDITLFGLFIRLSGYQTVTADPAKTDALLALRAAVRFVSLTTFSLDETSVDGIGVAIASMTYSLLPTKWDLTPMRFRFQGPGDQSNNHPISKVITEQDHSPQFQTEVMSAVEDMQRYAKHMVGEVVAPLWNQRADLPVEMLSLSDMPSRMLEFLLVMFLRSDRNQGSSAALRSALVLVSMVTTPILCEICRMESLVSSSSGHFRLTKLMRTTFELLADLVNDEDSELPACQADNFTPPEHIVIQFFDGPFVREDPNADLIDKTPVAEFGTSLVMILLNLLACILELGETKRSTEEEEEIKSLAPSLEKLSMVDVSIKKADIDAGRWADINEAASHVLSLIKLRSGEPSHAIQSHSLDKSVEERLRIIEQDLQSKEPPLRARGVSLLRQLIVSGELSTKRQDRITIVSEEEFDTGEGRLSEKVFSLLLDALADEESYVYLGAIQTLAMVTSMPQFFPGIIAGITNGTMILNGRKIRLLLQQRVKLTEVVITVLRRSPSVLHDRATMVLEMLLFGKVVVASENCTDSLEIQRKTIEFFERKDDDDSAIETDQGAAWKEKEILLNTGGPVFAAEEPDLVKSTLITLASETVALAHPSVTARCCAGLVECAKVSLSFESARPIRRSGARLACSLYKGVVREMEEVLLSAFEKADTYCPMTIAMIKANEEALAGILRRVVTGEDCSAGLYLSDPGVSARCEEALLERESAETGGMFAAAQIAIDKGRKDNPFLVQMLSTRKTVS